MSIIAFVSITAAAVRALFGGISASSSIIAVLLLALSTAMIAVPSMTTSARGASGRPSSRAVSSRASMLAAVS